jgi:hypothetical protein
VKYFEDPESTKYKFKEDLAFGKNNQATSES